MRRELRVVAAPVFENDATVVDRTVSERARDEMMHEATTVSKPLTFEDMPTTVWVPGSGKPKRGGSAIRPSARRLRSVETGPNVQIATEYQSFSARDEVTRIEAPPPVKPREDTTAPGAAQRREAERRRRVPIRIAIAAMLVVVAGMGGVALKRHNAQRLAAQAPVPATAHVAPAASHGAPTTLAHAATPVRQASPVAPAAFAVVPAPTPAAAAPVAALPAAVAAPAVSATESPKSAPAAATSAAPPAPSSSDEQAAVEAVQSGNVVRAARLYSSLAAAHPGNDAYREAARILTDASKESAR